jgi:glutathione S-transferase
MSPNDPSFVLRTTVTSPFGRKVRMAIEILGLSHLVVIEPADTLDDKDTLRQQNPLGKMPCLLLPDGTAIYDSGVIIEFLAEGAGSDALVPPDGPGRYIALTRARLADGITEAALLMVYEGRFRDSGTQSARWLVHQSGKIKRALATFEATPPDEGRTDLVAIGLSCALGYLDWRKPVKWRDDHPRVVKWLAEFAAREPAFARTAAHDA